MSLKIVAALLAGASLVGVALGYYLRLIISLGKRGSMELELKQMELAAKDREKEIIEGAEQKAEKILEEARIESKEKEEKAKKTEERLIKKEEMLDKRQIDIDSEVDMIKERIAEIKEIRDKAEKLKEERQAELERVGRLSPEEAKKYGVRSIPTVLILKDDVVVDTIIGANPKNKYLNALLSVLPIEQGTL